jgi:hypothetical protein
MTANELANEFKNRESHWKLINYIHWAEQAETMLRQQQAEIEKLRKIVEDTIGQAFYEDDYHKAQAEIVELRKFISLDENRRTEWYAYELDNEMKKYKKASEK